MKILNPKGDVNLHTHTYYCDGKDSPEALVQRAIALGFRALGFSGHEYTSFDADFCMSPADTEEYRREVLDLKEEYKDQIDIYLGIERDYFGDGDDYPYDYVIGSLHYVKAGEKYLPVDYTEEITQASVDRYFGGDYRSYVESYYETIADVVEKTGADIVGHFDLITKFNEGGRLFDENAPWYREAALTALQTVAASKPIFEINTGAMERGYRTKPYPADFLLAEIERRQCPVILSSDCHDLQCLDYGFRDFLTGN